MPVFKCKMCGASLEVSENQTIATCDYCGTKQTLPKLNDDLKAQMYDRANHFRRNNDFDKAESIYEQILEKDNTDAEVYWSLVLCRYGVEYVEDPQTHKRIPTVNRTQFTSIFDDEDYKSAIKYADSNQRTLYEQEAKMINDIQKNILAISKNEEPFDVFICYKETDSSGRRTPDSVLANDIYHQLTQEGFKVFFSRITLEDKLGTAYEPYIFAALNSAKVMIVLGTKPEYFNAVWVKNEWSRYLKLVQKSNGKKILIPAYRDMDPYDLPDEFSHLQAQDMSKIGFMQDLIRGIKKIVEEEPQVQNNVLSHSSDNSQVAPLLKRISLFLEDGEWKNADEYCERVLDIDPENGEAYLYKLMVELEVRKREKLCLCDEPFDESENYKKIIRFGNQELIDEVNGYIHYIRCEKTWYNADWLADCAAKEKGEEAIKKYEEAYNEFISIKDFKEEGDPEQRAKECLEKINEVKYSMAEDLFNQDKIESVEQATQYYESLGDYNNSRERIIDCQNKIKDLQIKAEELEILRKQRAEERRLLIAKRNRKIKKYTVIVATIVVIITIVCVIAFVFVIPNAKYNKAVTLMNSGNYTEAIELFEELGDYKDSVSKKEEAIDSFYNEGLSLLNDNKYEQAIKVFDELGNYKDSADILYDLKLDLYGKKDTIVATYFNTLGLKSDGTVVAVGDNYEGKCNVDDWNDIIAVSAGYSHTVGLKSDGTVVATGSKGYGRCNVYDWTDIIAVSAGVYHTVGLKSDGTVVSAGDNKYGQCDVNDWADIVAVSTHTYHTVGLKSDGTVVATGLNGHGQCDVDDWTDIITVSAGVDHTVGLKSDGTVVAVGNNDDGQCDVDGWTDIVAISASGNTTIGLKSDGTVVAAGSNMHGQCDVDDWTDIISVSTSGSHTVGLKSDGTVVAIGDNEYGQCDVDTFKDIKIPE